MAHIQAVDHDARFVTPCECNLPCEVTFIHAEMLLSLEFMFQIKRVITADLNGVNTVFK